MKILKLRILNLNSLRGEHVVDFTKAPLAHHQLYAIVGPTGAGKTTILDAITLALYGKTERNKSELDREDGSVLTYGEGHCAAELEYETNTGRYRSVWTRQRAHQKPTGALQGSKHRLIRLDTEDGKEKILATSKKEVAVKTVEAIGLDYDRFVRSTMLTQGEFARFLKSNKNEKASILEKITGTDIYAELGMAAYQRHDEAATALERARALLAANPPLLPEERQALLDDRSTSDQQLTELKAALAAVTQNISHHESFATLVEKETTKASEKAKAEEAWIDLAPERHQLANSNQVSELRESLEKAKRLRQELDDLVKARDGFVEKSQHLEAQLSEATERVRLTSHDFTEFQTDLPAVESRIKKAVEIESSLSKTNAEIELLVKQHTVAQREVATLEARIKTNENQIEALSRSLNGLSAEGVERKIADEETRIKHARTTLNNLQKWSRIFKLEESASREKAENAALLKAIENYRTEHKSQSEDARLRSVTLEERTALLQFYQARFSLADHQHTLVDGQPCPLCGALEHPAIKDLSPVTDERLKELSGQRDAAQKAERDAVALLTKTKTLIEAATANSTKTRNRLQLIETDLAEADRPASPRPPSLAALEETLMITGDHLKTAESELAKLKELRAHLPELLKLESNLTADRATLVANVKKSQGQAEILSNSQRLSSQQQQELTTLIGAGQRADDLRRATTARERVLSQAKTSAETQLAKINAESKAAKEQLLDLKNRASKNQQSLSQTEKALAKSLSELNYTEDQARSYLLPIAEEKRLRELLQSTENRRAAVTAQHLQITDDLKVQRKILEGIPAKETLEGKKLELTAANSAKERRLGALNEQLVQDDLRIQSVADQQDRLVLLTKERDRWAVMKDLIGDAKGAKFRGYAQALTLRRLIDIGNDHLALINPRYRMEYDTPPPGGKEELNIVVIDLHQNDNRRTMATLSGGESFLMSLALALGLSDLASGKALIQSLFIDEGFGTLSGEALERALTTLESLRSTGKSIGLISHVATLKERINCQIVVEPVGEGYSTVRFTPA